MRSLSGRCLLALELIRRRLVVWGTVAALACAAGLVSRPVFDPRLAGGPAIGFVLFVLLARGRPRFPDRPARVIAARTAYLVAAASFEEVVWRGIALTVLVHPLGPVTALAVTSVLFALSHRRALGRGSVVHLVTGAAFGTACLSGGLVSAILAHAVYNVLVDLGVQAAARQGTS